VVRDGDRRLLAEPVEVEQRPALALAQLVERQLDAVVAERDRGPGPGAAGPDRRLLEEVEDDVGDPLGLLDVDEVAGAVEGDEATAGRQVVLDVLGLRAPAHQLGDHAEHGQHRHAQQGQAPHGPLGPPGAEAAHAHGGVDLPAPAVVVVAGADGDQVAQPLGREAGVHAPAAGGQLVDGAGLAHVVDGAAADVEPRREVAGQHLGALVVGHLGDGPARREAVEVDELRDPVGQRAGHLEEQRAALGVAHDGERVGAEGGEDGGGVADVGVPGVEGGVLGVAVAALVPGDHPPAGLGEERREDVEGAGEVEAAVEEGERRRGLPAPLVDGDAQAVGVDLSDPVRWAGTRELAVAGLVFVRSQLGHRSSLGRLPCTGTGSGAWPSP
jgi:hypothetical protein